MVASGLGFALGGLAGVGSLLDLLDRRRRADSLEEMRLRQGQGTFVPMDASEAPDRSFTQALFGGGLGPDTYDLGGGRLYRFQPYAPLGPEGAKALGLTMDVNVPSTAPPNPQRLLSGFATDAEPTVRVEQQPLPGAAELPVDPKTRLELLKDAARQRRQAGIDATRLERTKLWLQRQPASIQKFTWLRDALNSDDPDIQNIAQTELDRLAAPSDRIDLGRDRLEQQDRQNRERLDQRLTELDTRIEAMKARGETRDLAAMERLRERLAARREEQEFLESGKTYRRELSVDARRGTGTSDSPELTTDEAEQKLQELRGKPYFPGQSGDKLTTLDRAIGKFKAEGRSHVGPVISKQIRRLEQQLNNAQRREGVRPQSPAPVPGRQSSALSPDTEATPQPVVNYFARYYQGMDPDTAEGDLKAAMAKDPMLLARGIPSPRTIARQLAFSSVFPDRQMTMRLPAPAATPTPGAAPAPAAPPAAIAPPPQPAPAAPAPVQTQRTQTAPRQAPLPPQAQALLGRFVREYNSMPDDQLTAEEGRLQSGVAGLDTLSQFRQRAIDIIRARREGAGGPVERLPGEEDTPLRPRVPTSASPRSQRMPKGLEEHQRYVEEYRALSPAELQTEARRVLLADPLARTPESNFRLTALNLLMNERKAAKPTGDYVDDAVLARYRNEVKDWSTAKLVEQSSTIRGVIGGMLSILPQMKPETFAAVGKAARWAREAAALGGAVASYPGAAAGLPFIAPIALGLSLKTVADAFPEARTALKEAYHRQLAIGLELHERMQGRNAPRTEDEAAD